MASPPHISAAILLDLLDYGMAGSTLKKGRLLLEIAAPDVENHGDVLIGDRDRIVWSLRPSINDQPAEGLWTCASCGQEMEVSFPDDFKIPELKDPVSHVSWEGQDYEIRLPKLSDLEQAQAEAVLFSPTRLNADAPWDNPEFQKAAEAALDTADPGMFVTFQTDCDACGATQENVLNVVDFVWAELNQFGQRATSEILFLAERLGWSEADILAMSAKRRARYVRELQQ